MYRRLISIILISLAAIAPAMAADTVGSKLPRLSSGPLSRAVLADLDKDILFSADGLNIRTDDLEKEIAAAPKELRLNFSKYRFFTLEQMAARKLLAQEAKEWAAKNGVSEDTAMRKYLDKVLPRITITDAEALDFYNANRSMFQGASFNKVESTVKAYLAGEKRDAAVRRYMKTTGSRHSMKVSRDWAGKQYKIWIQNPVERMRRSGKPTLVEFGKEDCIGCRIMAPLLDDLRSDFKGKLNVLNVNVVKDPVLSEYYDAAGLPMQIFYDKTGREIARNDGVINRNNMNDMLRKIGIK